MKIIKKCLSLFLSCCLGLMTVPGELAAQSDPSQAPVQAAPQTPEQLQQLVAPIALYPDALVAQILAAATYPDQVVEADRWLQQHSDLKGEQLGQEVDKQPWDPSVKALAEFPSVLANMDKNLSWTSSLDCVPSPRLPAPGSASPARAWVTLMRRSGKTRATIKS